jgi:hypothetical protein
MGKGPKPPNPYEQAAAQQQAELSASMGSSIINNPNVYSPYGSQQYSIAGYETVYDAKGNPMQVPRYNMTQTLSPEQQNLYNLNTQMQANLGQTGVEQSAKLQKLLGTNVTTAGLQGWNAGPQAAKLATTFADVGGPQRSIASQNIRQDQGPTDRASLEREMMSRYDTDASKQNEAQRAQLAAQGVNYGSSMYGSAADMQNRARTDAVGQAYLASGQESRAAQDAYNRAAEQRFQQGAAQGQFANSAQLQAYQQAMDRAGFSNKALSDMFSMGGQSADRGNALRQAQWQERLSERNQPLNEISALLAGSQVTVPQFQPYSAQGIGAAPIGQYIGQNYANEANAYAQQMAGLFGLGGSIAGGIGSAGGPMAFLGLGSDRRLKQDIEPLGMRLAGAPLYQFRYIEDPAEIQVGVMSDEVRPLHPDAVHEVDGYDLVDYGLLLSRHGGH